MFKLSTGRAKKQVSFFMIDSSIFKVFSFNFRLALLGIVIKKNRKESVLILFCPLFKGNVETSLII